MPGRLTLQWPTEDQSRSCTVAEGESILIGRHPDCGIPLTDPTISRWHAAVTCQGNGAQIENLSPTNPIYLNERMCLEQGERTPLQSGDSFRIGPVDFQVTQEADNSDATPHVTCGHCGFHNAGPLTDGCQRCGMARSDARTILAETLIKCSKCSFLNPYQPTAFCRRCGMALAGCETVQDFTPQ